MSWTQRTLENFPLAVGNVMHDYTRLPYDISHILYHYTSRGGLEGILRSGGLRATYRKLMNDPGEFQYARNVVYETLDEIRQRQDLPKTAESLAVYARKNLDQFLRDSAEGSRAYCACVTVSPDDAQQWASYTANGRGFAIGFDFHQFASAQMQADLSGRPHVYFAPVIYDLGAQRALTRRLVEAGIADLQVFMRRYSKRSEHLIALRARVTQEIVVHLLALIDFMKAPSYSGEREIRVMVNPNDGTLAAPGVQHYERNGEPIPYVFIDMRNPATNRISLAEIRIGPNASFPEELDYVEKLLDELGYGRGGYHDRPRIEHSRVSRV
jgi:Protein of unknown function (DUF2971)